MSDIYRGSTPTLIFTPLIPVSGVPSVRLFQDEVMVEAENVVWQNGQLRCHLTSHETALFTTDEDVFVQMVWTSQNETVAFNAHALSVGENYFEFMEADNEEEEDGPESFLEADLDETDSPVALGVYEYNSLTEEYFESSDVTNNESKIYYYPMSVLEEYIDANDDDTKNYIQITDVDEWDSPELDGWFELVNEEYIPSQDEEPVNGKTYYILDQDMGYEDEEAVVEQEFDGDAFCEDNDISTDWEVDLDEEDYEYWDESEDFDANDNSDNLTISYVAVQPEGDENPVNMAWLVLVDGEYEFTNDKVVEPGTTYYDMVVEDHSSDEEE